LLLSFLRTLFKSLAYIDKKAYFIKQLKQSKNKEVLLKKIAAYIYDDNKIRRLIYKLDASKETDFKRIKKDIVHYFTNHL